MAINKAELFKFATKFMSRKRKHMTASIFSSNIHTVGSQENGEI